MSRTEARATAAFLLLLLGWDVSGLDRVAARAFGSASGFAARDAWWASTLLHDGGRIAAWVLMAALIATALRAPRRAVGEPSRAERGFWLGVTLLGLLLVPALKRVSATSCPWDLAEFGGHAWWLSHWRWGVADGGGGHCFPSGHAVAAFAFLSQYFLWRPHDPRRARHWLWAVLCTGTLFGVAQLARGAHFPSHTAWSAALCWGLGLGAAWRARRWAGTTALAGRTMAPRDSPGAPDDRCPYPDAMET